VVSIIFLAVLTGLGINAMRTSALEEKMASNTEHYNFAFQTAETGLAVSFSGAATTPAEPAPDDEEDIPLTTHEVIDGVPVACDEDDFDCGKNKTKPALDTRVWYKSESKVPPPGYSLDGPFATHHFSMSSDARYGTTRAQLSQGFRRLGPRSNQ
jgi:hypothetical protein